MFAIQLAVTLLSFLLIPKIFGVGKTIIDNIFEFINGFINGLFGNNKTK